MKMTSGSAVENICSQVRGLSKPQIEEQFQVVLTSLAHGAPASDYINALRQIHSILSSRTDVEVPEKLIHNLHGVMNGANSSPLLRALSQAVLRDNPCSDSNKEVLPPYHKKYAPAIMNLSILQGPKHGDYGELLQQIVRWISTVGFDLETQSLSLVFATAIAVSYKHLLTKDQVHVISSQIAEWLHKASTLQGNNPYSKGFFKSEQRDSVTEIDGGVTRDFFTVLNIGQYYTDDQIMNIHSFSALYGWLLHTLPSCPGGSPLSLTPVPPGEQKRISGTFNTDNVLKEKALEYCFRIIDQSERKAKVAQDAVVQQCALNESIRILHLLCKTDSSLVPRVIHVIKRVQARDTKDTASPLPLLGVVQFFLNHSETVVYDPQLLYDQFFDKVLPRHLHDHTVIFDTVTFIRDNLEKICFETNILQKYFPNVLKMLAWQPRTYARDFMEIVPALMAPTAAIEVLHTLLDLPCLSAALEIGLKTCNIPKVMESYQNPKYKPWFNFILRNEGGHGDTVDRLDILYSALDGMQQQPRVLVCAQIVPVMLRLYFSEVLEEGDQALASLLVPIILERVGLIYDVPSYRKEVRSLLSEYLVELFKKYPKLLMEQHNEIIEYVGSLRNISGKEDFFVHMIWIVGEYLSEDYDKKCTPEIVSKYYETLECLAYEISALLQSASTEQDAPYSVRLLVVIMTTLAKLSSRCQDIIPRVMLCLTKISQQHLDGNLEEESRHTLSDRANDLINLLRLPNVASVILNPPPGFETSKCHRDYASIPVLLRTIKSVLKKGIE
ncbi:AP-5 complex subunit zeta-1-like [Lineus longissimus]|uniref:AP-5 complex subunit zeta-1-like n=1 Tax=Lineus longissimus TaxID=88925 RepID=UPI002B4E66F9